MLMVQLEFGYDTLKNMLQELFKPLLDGMFCPGVLKRARPDGTTEYGLVANYQFVDIEFTDRDYSYPARVSFAAPTERVDDTNSLEYRRPVTSLQLQVTYLRAEDLLASAEPPTRQVRYSIDLSLDTAVRTRADAAATALGTIPEDAEFVPIVLVRAESAEASDALGEVGQQILDYVRKKLGDPWFGGIVAPRFSELVAFAKDLPLRRVGLVRFEQPYNPSLPKASRRALALRYEFADSSGAVASASERVAAWKRFYSGSVLEDFGVVDRSLETDLGLVAGPTWYRLSLTSDFWLESIRSRVGVDRAIESVSVAWDPSQPNAPGVSLKMKVRGEDACFCLFTMSKVDLEFNVNIPRFAVELKARNPLAPDDPEGGYLVVSGFMNVGLEFTGGSACCEASLMLYTFAALVVVGLGTPVGWAAGIIGALMVGALWPTKAADAAKGTLADKVAEKSADARVEGGNLFYVFDLGLPVSPSDGPVSFVRLWTWPRGIALNLNINPYATSASELNAVWRPDNPRLIVGTGGAGSAVAAKASPFRSAPTDLPSAASVGGDSYLEQAGWGCRGGSSDLAVFEIPFLISSSHPERHQVCSVSIPYWADALGVYSAAFLRATLIPQTVLDRQRGYVRGYVEVEVAYRPGLPYPPRVLLQTTAGARLLTLRFAPDSSLPRPLCPPEATERWFPVSLAGPGLGGGPQGWVELGDATQLTLADRVDFSAVGRVEQLQAVRATAPNALLRTGASASVERVSGVVRGNQVTQLNLQGLPAAPRLCAGCARVQACGCGQS